MVMIMQGWKIELEVADIGRRDPMEEPMKMLEGEIETMIVMVILMEIGLTTEDLGDRR